MRYLEAEGWRTFFDLSKEAGGGGGVQVRYLNLGMSVYRRFEWFFSFLHGECHRSSVRASDGFTPRSRPARTIP